jgi:hypothetical protein
VALFVVHKEAFLPFLTVLHVEALTVSFELLLSVESDSC